MLEECFGSKKNICGFWKYHRYSVIKGISENKTLFRWYVRNENFERYYSLNSALDNIDNKILIHFTDLRLFANVSDIEKLKKFISATKNVITDGGVVNMSQIILTVNKQKIIFTSQNKSEEAIERIRKHVMDYFKKIPQLKMIMKK